MHTLGPAKIDLSLPQNQDGEAGSQRTELLEYVPIRLKATLVLEKGFAYPGSCFVCSELCCHHRRDLHGVYIHAYWCLWKPEECFRYPGTGVTRV